MDSAPEMEFQALLETHPVATTVDRLRVYELLGRQTAAIKYLTFDELFEQVGAYHADKYLEPAERAGISLFAVVQLYRDCTDKGGCLFELGSDAGSNHVGVYRRRQSVLAVRVVERIQLRKDRSRKVSESLARPSAIPRGLSFAGSQFMYTEGHPIHDPIAGPRTSNLVQRENARRPTAC